MTTLNQIAPGKLVFESSDGWKIFRQDAGMGEWDYALFKNNEFYCRAPCREIADIIIGAIRFSANMRNAEKREKEIREDERKKTMNLFGIVHGNGAVKLKAYMEDRRRPMGETDEKFFREVRELRKENYKIT